MNARILGKVLGHPQIKELTDPVVLVEINKGGRRLRVLLGGSTPVVDWGPDTKYNLT